LVTDEEIERAIVECVRAGAFDVAKTLAAQLDARRRERMPSNVFAIDRKRK
jgi:hypothetical protein